jgi:hypothetical protein
MDEDGHIVAHDKSSKAGSSLNEHMDQRDKEAMQEQIDALCREIKRLQREANCKRQCIIMLTGATRAVDPVCKEGRDKVTENCRPLEAIRNKIKDKKLLKQMFIECGGYEAETLLKRGDNGSKIKLNWFRKVQAAVTRFAVDLQDMDILEDVRHRSRAYHTHQSRYRDIVKFLAFENKKLFTKVKLTRKEDMVERAKKMDEGVDYAEALKGFGYTAPKFMKDYEDLSVDMEQEDVHEVYQIKDPREQKQKPEARVFLSIEQMQKLNELGDDPAARSTLEAVQEENSDEDFYIKVSQTAMDEKFTKLLLGIQHTRNKERQKMEAEKLEAERLEAEEEMEDESSVKSAEESPEEPKEEAAEQPVEAKPEEAHENTEEVKEETPEVEEKVAEPEKEEVSEPVDQDVVEINEDEIEIAEEVNENPEGLLPIGKGKAYFFR